VSCSNAWLKRTILPPWLKPRSSRSAIADTTGFQRDRVAPYGYSIQLPVLGMSICICDSQGYRNALAWTEFASLNTVPACIIRRCIATLS